MALITLASASGSPGTTTSALALALTWPRPVLLVEADPTGNSAIAAGWFQGHPPHNRGLINLAMAQRQNDLPAMLEQITIPLGEDSTAQVITGARSPGQASTIAPVWDPLIVLLRRMSRAGTDIIIDLGRLGLSDSPQNVLRATDATLLVTRTTIPAATGARGWARRLSSQHATAETGLAIGLLTVGDGHPYTQKEMSGITGIPAIAALALDPVAADAISLGRATRRPLRKTSLIRSARAAVSAIESMTNTSTEHLTEQGAS